MYDSSPCTDSSANAARRCPAVVIAAIACQVTNWAETISKLAAEAAASRIPYFIIGTSFAGHAASSDAVESGD
jgi:hypothetical protein